MGSTPTYRDLHALLKRADSPGLALLPLWMSIHQRKMADQLCEPLCGPSWFQWTTITGQFWKIAFRSQPAYRSNAYLRRLHSRELRQNAMRLSSQHRQPDAAKELEKLRGLVAVRAAKVWPRSKMPETLKQFIDGRLFSFSNKSIRLVVEVEALCKLQHGALLAASRAALPQQFSTDLRPGRSREPMPKSYFLPLPAKLKAFVRSYREHKTCLVPTLRRFSRWSPNFAGVYVTGDIFEANIASRYSFMVRPKLADMSHPDYGLGLNPETIQPVDLFRIEIVIAHFRWAVAARGALSKAFAWTFFATGIAMINERSGFIYQQPDVFTEQLFRSKLQPQNRRVKRRADFFRRWCKSQYKTYWDFIAGLDLRDAQTKYSKVRNSRTQIDAILEMRQPMRALFDLIRAQAERERQNAFQSDEMRISHGVNTFLAAAMTAAPLRLMTWSGLKCGEHVFRREGRWHLKIERQLFKNRRDMKAPFYEITLPEWASPYFDDYHDRVRPRLLGAKAGSPYVFTYAKASTSDRSLTGPVSIPVLRGRLLHVTVTLWGAPIGAHSWRHIIATAILKDDPNAVARAAFVLNDTLETVANTYAHLTTRDAFAGFADWTDRLWTEVPQSAHSP